jgi:hypothetical protein
VVNLAVDKTDRRTLPRLDREAIDEKRKLALQASNDHCREIIKQRDPQSLAARAAISLCRDENNEICFRGDYFFETHTISWPTLAITGNDGNPVPAHIEALWLHYLERADGQPLSGRWVNLSEIGGLFYQQAFQGYCGDELAAAWGGDIEGLRETCRAAGGWPVPGLADLAFEWRALPRLSLCLCYRLPSDSKEAWATMLFDASARHYMAADVAATIGKHLADRLKPAGLSKRRSNSDAVN